MKRPDIQLAWREKLTVFWLILLFNGVVMFKQQAGQDVTSELNDVFDAMNSTYKAQNMNCLNNVFYWGQADFRKTARCQVQNYMLLIFSGIMMGSMGIKCTEFSPFAFPPVA